MRSLSRNQDSLAACCFLVLLILGAGLIPALRHLTLAPFRSSLHAPGCCNGGRFGEDAAGVRASGFRLWSGPRLAGESAAEALPGLEEAEAARQAGDNSEEAGPGLSACSGPSPPGPHSASPTRPGSGEPRDHTPGGVAFARLAVMWFVPSPQRK